MNEDVEEERHRNIDKELLELTGLVKENTKDITALKTDGREYKIEIKNLISKIDDFMTTIKWGLGIFVTIFIFYVGVLLK